MNIVTLEGFVVYVLIYGVRDPYQSIGTLREQTV